VHGGMSGTVSPATDTGLVPGAIRIIRVVDC
jgi:hypothetical protein